MKITKPEVIDMPSPNKNPRPEGSQINTIVLHHTASKAEAKSTGKFFQDPASKVSAHYTVDRTGYIVQSVSDAEASWHAGKSEFNGVANVNVFSIGIEICNVGDNIEAYPEAQYNAVIKLVSYLVKTYNVPLANITRHRDVAIPAGRKTDTSDNFSTKKVIDGVKLALKGKFTAVEKPYKPTSIPNTLAVVLEKDMTAKDIADVYLDNEVRENEISYLNPKLEGNIKSGTVVKIPADYNYFYQLRKKN
ncbi:MAG: N-acetylmuramoyl-L-alanine amidase [Candidatus Sericytochromatia bacterium]